MKSKHLFYCAVVSMGCLPQIAYAGCDISQFKDQLDYRKDILTNLAYIKRIASREDRSREDKADLNIVDYGSFTYANAAKLTSSIESLLDIRWTQHDQEWLLTSTLSDNGTKGYINCLQQENAPLVITLSDSASDSDEFIVTYAWRPTYAAPNPSTFHPLFVHGSSDDVPKTVATPSSDSFVVKRSDMHKNLDVAFHVDSQPYPAITLPAVPKKKLVKQIRKTDVPGSIYGCTSSVGKQACVELPNTEQDAIIVPQTFRATITTTTAERGSIVEGNDPRTYNERQACGNFVWVCGAGDAHVEGTVHVEALVLKAVPVE